MLLRRHTATPRWCRCRCRRCRGACAWGMLTGSGGTVLYSARSVCSGRQWGRTTRRPYRPMCAMRPCTCSRMQQVGMAGGRNALAEAVCGALGGALGLVQALGVGGAPQGAGCWYGAAALWVSEEPPQLPWWQLLAAQPQRLVAACCDVLGGSGDSCGSGYNAASLRAQANGRRRGGGGQSNGPNLRPPLLLLLQAVNYTGVHARSGGHTPPTAGTSVTVGAPRSGGSGG